MTLITVQEISMGFGGPLLLDKASFHIRRGDRICLMGRNGEGKSTLIKLLLGETPPDTGRISLAAGITLSGLPQEVPAGLSGTAREIVFQGLRNRTADPDWKKQQQTDRILSRFDFDPSAPFDAFSAGMKRRVLLARALVPEPDILFLDEPTNHLDIEAIQWLENYLLRSAATLFFVTHDRAFLKRLATRIIELDRGRISDWACDYETFLTRKDAALQAQEKDWALFDKKLAQEEIWIRKGVRERRTRNEGRVRALLKMRTERKERRERIGSARMQLQEAEKTGRLVLAADSLSYSYDGRPVVTDFSTTVQRGDRIGIIGPNGAGKTTLLKLLLKQLSPDAGTVRMGTKLQIAFFDQLRDQLDENKTVRENVADGNDLIPFNGKQRHVIGYLRDFLFPAERAMSPVRILSGGERNRLLLARLFAKPFNLLVMDEPTNDLDAETLELLEELLLEYSGTLLLVSHDRTFLNNVVTSTVVFEGNGSVAEYVGGYDDWIRQRSALSAETPKHPPEKKMEKRRQTPKKLGFNEQRELASLPQKIEELEAEQKQLYVALSDPAAYQSGAHQIPEKKKRLLELEELLETAYRRWEALEEMNR